MFYLATGWLVRDCNIIDTLQSIGHHNPLLRCLYSQKDKGIICHNCAEIYSTTTLTFDLLCSVQCSVSQLTKQQTNSMEQSFLRGQQHVRLAKKLSVHNSPSPVPILSRTNPIHILQPRFPKIHFNITLSSTPTLPSGFLPSGFPTEMLHALLISPCVLNVPAPLILELVILTIFVPHSATFSTLVSLHPS
jgi:hypothetical protein